jgi:polysaccharide pyruvyl transferase WcaK-like protein
MVYYLHILKRAIKRCPKTMLYSNGIGPIRRNRHRKKAAMLLSLVDKIAVRDRKSFDYLNTIGVINDNITVTADETFTISKDRFKVEYPLQKNKRYLCVNLRAFNISEQFLTQFAKFLNDVCSQYGLTPLLVPVHFGQDYDVLYKLSQKLKVPSILINQKLEHYKTLSIISQCEAAILERLHAVIFSSIFGVPFMAINYDPKVLSHCIETGMEKYMLSLERFDKNEALATFDALYGNRNEISNQLTTAIDKKREYAKLNAQIAHSLLSEI